MGPDRYYINIIITSGNQPDWSGRLCSLVSRTQSDAWINNRHSLCTRQPLPPSGGNNPHCFYPRGVESWRDVTLSEQFRTMQNILISIPTSHFAIHRSHLQSEQWGLKTVEHKIVMFMNHHFRIADSRHVQQPRAGAGASLSNYQLSAESEECHHPAQTYRWV